MFFLKLKECDYLKSPFSRLQLPQKSNASTIDRFIIIALKATYQPLPSSLVAAKSFPVRVNCFPHFLADIPRDQLKDDLRAERSKRLIVLSSS